MRVVGNKEGNGEGSKGGGDSNKGVGQGMVLVTKWAMVTATRVGGEEESKHGKGYGSNDEMVGNQ